MRRITAGLVALLWCGVALAAHPLHFGPPAGWVVPQAVPTAVEPTQAAVQFLLADRQVELTAKSVNYYVENAIRIQTPQGLSALGTITLIWDPDTDVLVVHKVDLIRGGKVINLLADGRRFTIAKRETNLEAATLDDTLTAILQPPGLRIGDIVDVAYTLERRQPLLAGTPSAEVQVPWALPVSRLHIRALWSPSLPIRWQEGQGLAVAHRIEAGGDTGISLTMCNVSPVLQPRLAPLRFLVDRRVDFSAFRSWAQLARRFAPLYRKAARLGPHSPLLAQVARIRAASTDPVRQAALALRLVESQVRYLFLDFNDGGLKPASAGLTWSRRFGDCKAKTALLLALLHALGIQAEPVAVNVFAGDAVQGRLPMIQLFDHVLVRAVIAGRTYWLDGTRLGDRSLAQLRVPYYHWGLPLTEHGAQLLPMVPPPPRRPLSDTHITIDASAGILRPAPFRARTSMHGDAGLFIEQRLANLTPDQLDEALRRYWTQQYGFVHITSVSAHYDRKRHAERFQMNGTARLRWRDHDYLTDGLGVGMQADFARSPGPAREAPYAVAYPFYTRTREAIRLPQAGKGFSLVGADVDRTVAGIHYERRASIQAGVFRAVASARSVAREFPAEQAAQDQRILRRLSQSNLYLRAPAGMVTRRAVAKHAEQRAIALLGRGDPPAAIAALDQAIAVEGPRAALLAARALAEVEAGDVTTARNDVAAVHSSDPRVAAESDLAAGMIAFDSVRMPAAIRSLSAALTLKPALTLARVLRCQAYLRRGEYQRAAADAAAEIRATPPGPVLLQLYWMRAATLAHAGETTAALRQAAQLVKALPYSPAAYYMASRIDSAFGAPTAARAMLNAGVRLHPHSTVSYTMRIAYRPWRDIAGRRADVEAALKLDPRSTPALLARANLEQATGRYHRALRTLDALLARPIAPPGASGADYRINFLVTRGIVYSRLAERNRAQRDFAAARAATHSAVEFAELCEMEAVNGVAVHEALAECATALKHRPYDALLLNADATALLRLGRCRAAIRAYDGTLRLAPSFGWALYGRGACERRLGQMRRGSLDIRIAKIDSSRVAGRFAHYGLSPPGAPAAATTGA